MRKPKSVKFGHRDLSIKYITHKEANKRGIYGEVQTSTNTILIDKSLDGKVTLNTIIHELIHVIAEHYHWNLPAKDEELVCETTGNALADLFNQNPKLVEYLAFVFKKVVAESYDLHSRLIMDKIDSKEIEIIEPKKIGRPKFEFTEEKIKQIYELASIMCSKQEIGTIIGCSHDTIERNEQAMESYRMGVANAKATIKRTQFRIATKLNSAQMAMWLGKVYLKQDRDDDEDESNNPLPLTDIV